jgi:hypothetical protein
MAYHLPDYETWERIYSERKVDNLLHSLSFHISSIIVVPPLALAPIASAESMKA